MKKLSTLAALVVALSLSACSFTPKAPDTVVDTGSMMTGEVATGEVMTWEVVMTGDTGMNMNNDTGMVMTGDEIMMTGTTTTWSVNTWSAATGTTTTGSMTGN